MSNDDDHSAAGARVRMWEVWHFQIGSEDGFELDKADGQSPRRIGIFSSDQRASEAVEYLQAKPGFRNRPGGFRIFQGWLDEDSWAAGFMTAEQAWQALPDAKESYEDD